MKLHKNDLTHTTGNRSVFPIDPYSVSLQIGVEAAEARLFNLGLPSCGLMPISHPRTVKIISPSLSGRSEQKK